MILVEATGYIDKTPEVKDIERPGSPGFKLAVASLNWTVKRGEKDTRMWIDVEAVGDKAWELADLPLNMEVKVTGTLERHAWKDKQTDEWRHKYVIKFSAADVGAVPGQAGSQAPPPDDSDIPF